MGISAISPGRYVYPISIRGQVRGQVMPTILLLPPLPRIFRHSYGPATMQKMLSGTAFVCENDLQLVFGGSTILILLEL